MSVIYADIRDIPLEVLANGGRFDIVSGVPAGVRKGKGFGAMKETDARSHGVIDKAEKDENGDLIKITATGIDPYAPGLSAFNAGAAPVTMGWDWLIYVIIAMVIIATVIATVLCVGCTLPFMFLGVMAMAAVGVYTVTTIWGPKQGRVIGEVNEDGSYNFESDDGTIIHFNADGTYEQVRGPSAGFSIFGDMGKIVKYGVIGGVGIGLTYLGFQAYSSIKHKRPFKAPAFESFASGVSNVASSGAKAGTKLLGA